MQDFIELATILANELADEAGEIIRPYFRANVAVESKSDASPVTIADRNVEQRLREIIEAKRPDDGIIGEEFDIKPSKNQYDWVLDPIDGTKSFIIGRPTFGTLIALCENGVPILGIIDQPILNERWVGVKGQATLFSRHARKREDTTFNGKEVSTRKCDSLKAARVASTDPHYLSNDLCHKLHEASGIMAWGGDCYSFGLIASGTLDAVIESGLSTYDYAALPPIINGSGGWMGDWNGNDLNIKSDGRVIAVGDIALKNEVLGLVTS